MNEIAKAIAIIGLAFAVPANGQEGTTALTVSGPAETRMLVPSGTVIELVTDNALSSKKNVKGDLLRLRVTAPVIVDGVTAIPAGTPVVAQLTTAIERGAFGRSGRLEIELLYAELPGGTLRVRGMLEARGKKDAGGAAATAVAFLALPFLATGRSAEIPAGTEVSGRLDHDLWIDRH